MGEHKISRKRAVPYKAKKARSTITTVIVLLAVIVVLAIDIFQRQDRSPMAEANFEPQRTRGSAQAPLKIVEFVDFQCAQCAKGADVLKEFIEKYPEAIQLTVKYFPLGELNSTISAYYGECAARQGKFWELLDRMFKEQEDWRTLLRVKQYLDKLVTDAGLDMGEMEKCVERKDVKTLVEKERAMGESYFIKSTPSYFINGELVVGVHALREHLEKYFEKKSADSM